jgi:hypothetical protein
MGTNRADIVEIPSDPSSDADMEISSNHSTPPKAKLEDDTDMADLSVSNVDSGPDESDPKYPWVMAMLDEDTRRDTLSGMKEWTEARSKLEFHSAQWLV